MTLEVGGASPVLQGWVDVKQVFNNIEHTKNESHTLLSTENTDA